MTSPTPQNAWAILGLREWLPPDRPAAGARATHALHGRRRTLARGTILDTPASTVAQMEVGTRGGPPWPKHPQSPQRQPTFGLRGNKATPVVLGGAQGPAEDKKRRPVNLPRSRPCRRLGRWRQFSGLVRHLSGRDSSGIFPAQRSRRPVRSWWGVSCVRGSDRLEDWACPTRIPLTSFAAYMKSLLAAECRSSTGLSSEGHWSPS